jgi:cytochrome c oxidase subunit IV
MSHNSENRLEHVSHGHSVAAPHHHVNYIAIFLLLVVLTGITVAVAFVGIEKEWIKILLALTIASIKAAFVATFFMHLKFEGKLIYMIAIVPLCLTVILVCALIPDIVMPALNHTLLGRP